MENCAGKRPAAQSESKKGRKPTDVPSSLRPQLSDLTLSPPRLSTSANSATATDPSNVELKEERETKPTDVPSSPQPQLSDLTLSPPRPSTLADSATATDPNDVEPKAAKEKIQQMSPVRLSLSER
jgi:hypothetical protein